MLAIRLQRTGRSGHSQFRLIAQDSRFSPKRGRVVAYLGSYNPHTKEAKLDTAKIAQYLDNGAQPSDSAAKLLSKEGVKLPAWVNTAQPKKSSVRNPEKRRSTSPAEAEAPAPSEDEAASDAAPADESTASQTESPDKTDESPAPAAEETAPAETSEAPVEAEPEKPAEPAPGPTEQN